MQSVYSQLFGKDCGLWSYRKNYTLIFMVALEIPLDGEGTRHKAQLLNVATQAECSIAINMNTVCAAFRFNMFLCHFFFHSFCRIQNSVVSVQYITHLICNFLSARGGSR